MNDDKLIITYDTGNPIPLTEIMQSFEGFNELYKEKNTQLSIKEVRKGSQIFDIVATTIQDFPEMMPYLVSTASTIVNYYNEINTILEFFKSKKNKGKREFTASEAKSAQKIITPLGGDTNAKLILENPVFNGNVTIYNYSDAKTIKEESQKFIEEKSLTHLYWSNLARKEEVGNKSIVPDVFDKSVPTRFGSTAIYQKMVQTPPHPFKHKWRVDLHVEINESKPLKYIISNVVEDLGET